MFELGTDGPLAILVGVDGSETSGRTARGGESPDDLEPDDGHDGRCDVGHCHGVVVRVVVTDDEGIKLHLCGARTEPDCAWRPTT